jgi:PEGA domain-containing protein
MPGEREEETPTIPLIVTRIVAATTSLDEFVAQYCRYFGVDVLFLPTEGVQPPGRRVRFVFALASDEEVITGEGIVLRMRRDTGDPARPPGMELRYEVLDEASQRVVNRMVEQRTSSTVLRRPDPPPYVSIRLDDKSDDEETRPGGPLPGWGGVPALDEPLPGDGPALNVMPTSPPRRDESTAVTRPALRMAPPPPSPSLPANPFADVPIHAIEFFVEWAVRRATTRGLRRPRSTSFAEVDMEAPPRWRLSRASLGISAAILLVAFSMAMELSYRAHMVDRSRPSLAFGVGGNAAPAASIVPPLPVTPPAPPPPAPAPLVSGRGGTLNIATSPSGSDIFVDGQPRGSSPLLLAVSAGAHEIVAERPRYAPARAHIDGGGRVKLTHERPVATLRVTSAPTGATVELDGDFAGATPIDLVCSAYENHRVQLELDGHVRHRHLYLKPPVGNIAVEFAPKDRANTRAHR